MNIRTTAFFDHRGSRDLAVTELARERIVTEHDRFVATPIVALKTEQHNHDQRMWRFGLVGAALGCVLGCIIVNHVHGKEIMYTAIVPFSCTYWGLALGLFLAMGIQHARMVCGIMQPDTDLHLAGEKSLESSSLTVITESLDGARKAQELLRAFGATAFDTEVTTDEVPAITLERGYETQLSLTA